MSEVKEHHRDLAVAFYDYKKGYDMVHHDFMIMVYRWMGIPEKVCKLLETLMSMWKTRLEINVKGSERKTSRLQGRIQGGATGAQAPLTNSNI